MQDPQNNKRKYPKGVGVVQFILFLDPHSKQFYSYSHEKGILIQQKCPGRISKYVTQQLSQLKRLINNRQFFIISQFQRRPLPLSYIIQPRYKYPVYLTNQQLPKAMLQDIKFNQNSVLMKQQLIDYIQADIYLQYIQDQLQTTRKQRKMVQKVTTNIKLIASANEVILTLGRIILQDYCVVITTVSPKNKLIFKIKDKNQYLYGNDPLMNFQCVRMAIKNKQKIQLEIVQQSVYDKQQFTKFIFQRQADDVKKGNFASFPWQRLFSKYKNIEQIKFLMWYCPHQQTLDPKSILDYDKLYSAEQLTRANQKIRLKLQLAKRKGIRRIPRYLWKNNIMNFLDKRRLQIKNKYIQLDNSVIYSGQQCFKYQVTVSNIYNLFGLFRNQDFSQNRHSRRAFIKLQNKQLTSQQQLNTTQSLPSTYQRQTRFTQCKKQGLIDVIPYMITIGIQYTFGNQIMYKDQTQPVLAASHVLIQQKFMPNLLCNLMMETNIVFKVKVYNKQGEGVTCGIGVMKMFDQFGYLLQGKQEVQLIAISNIDMNKIGCLSQTILFNKTMPFITVQLPKFRKPVIWTLKDKTCLKYLGYLPSAQDKSQSLKSSPQVLSKLDVILSYNPLRILKLTHEQKLILKKNFNLYKNQPQKLIFYLYSIDWTNPFQIQQAYLLVQKWQPLNPQQALFLLNPKIADQKIRYFAVQHIQKMYQYQLIFYSNQIVQSLVSFQTDQNPLIQIIIQKCCSEPYTIGQQYFWQFRNRLEQGYTCNRFMMYLESLVMTCQIRDMFIKQIDVDNVLMMKNQELIKITEKYKEFEEKKSIFKTFVPDIQSALLDVSKDGFFFPIRPQNVFKQLLPNQCKLFNSKKMPFSLACIPQQNSDIKKQTYRVIYKCGDDIKQDHLVLQLFNYFQKLWASNGLDFKMSIYRVISTGNQNGFIQVVQNASNSSLIHQNHGKDKIIKAFDVKAALSFLQYHNKGTDLLIAKQNFLRSSVGYFVSTYVLGIGDRHSGNIMVQKNGKFFHIDFGHFLGNFKKKFNIKRQRTPVTFTPQYAQVMGGIKSNQFARFQRYCSSAFNILRKNAYSIINMLIMMVSAQIPQLRSYVDIQYVVDKLDLDLSTTQVNQKISRIIRETLESQARNIDNMFHQWNRGG